MQQLYDTLRGHFEELQEILNGGDVNQFEVYEAQSFCTTIAETITLMEANLEEVGQILGKGHELELSRLKECAVVVYKSIPYLEKIDEILGSHNDEIYEVVDTYMDSLESFDSNYEGG